jgi:hypothetical protein
MESPQIIMFSLPKNTRNIRRMNFGKFTLYKYVKPMQKRDSDAGMGVFRSVVMCEDKVMCVAPPRAMPLADFIEKYQFENVTVDEIVDGTMVNVFFADDEWRRCTKANVGATNGFLEGAPTFGEMFDDVAIKFDELDRNRVHSFVLQHPQNRIVSPVSEPRVVLIKSYSISGREVAEMSLPPNFPRPAPVVASSYADLKEAALKLPFERKGFMLHAPDGTRSKIFGDAYLKISALRGSESSVKFRLLQLRDKAELTKLIEFYPEFGALATSTKMAVRRFTNELFSMYLDCYKSKTKPLKEYPYEFKRHLCALHHLYIAEWPTPIHKKRVVDYVSTLHAAELSSAGV